LPLPENHLKDNFMTLERHELYAYCENLPEPIVARPVVILFFRRGMNLALDCNGRRVTLTEIGQPCTFSSIDAIVYELDGTSNVDMSRLEVDLSSYWSDKKGQ
jgi:hypothetical protein